MIEFIEEKYTTAKDFLAKLRLSDSSWTSDTNGSDQNWDNNWIFRGQSADWPLLPKAWRKNEILNNVRNEMRRQHEEQGRESLGKYSFVWNKFLQKISKEVYLPDLVDLSINAFAEIRLINEFSQLADELGLRFERLPQEILKWESLTQYIDLVFPELDDAGKIKQRVLDSFRENGRYRASLNQWPNRHNFIDYPWLFPVVALAQHHGIPTRLLDWTRNPLTATFFAVAGIQTIKPEDNPYIIVFALNTTTFSFPESHIKLINVPATNNDFLRAQSGLFTLDLSGDEYFVKNNKKEYPDLASSMKELEALPTPIIQPRKLMLTASEGPELIRLLWLEKVTQAHLMPTLDNVSKTIETKYRSV